MRQSNNLHLEHLGVKVGSVFPPKYPDNTCSHGTTPNRKNQRGAFHANGTPSELRDIGDGLLPVTTTC